MKGSFNKGIKFVKNNNLLNKDDKVLIGLSGGADSVFLLLFLLRLKEKYNLELACIHVNHMLRGADANLDQKFCKELCFELNVKYYGTKVNVNEYAALYKKSTEEAARELRYNEYIKLKEKLGFNKIATGHNLDDNVETILQRLIEGTGIKGLRGIPIIRDEIYIRPILSYSKKEIMEYVTESGYEYRVDKSNFENDYKRNFLRNEIIPLISKLNPSFQTSIFRVSQIYTGFYDILIEKINYLIDKYVKFENENLVFLLELFDNENEFVVGEVIKLSFEKYLNYAFNYDDFNNLLQIVDLQVGKHIMLKENYAVLREREYVVVLKYETKTESEYHINIGESLTVNGVNISLQLLDINQLNNIKEKNTEFIDYDLCEEAFSIREWVSGDRFQPLGMTSFKKISDFLNEQKVSALRKKNQLILTNRNNIVYVFGLRIDNRYKITEKTRKVIKIWIN